MKGISLATAFGLLLGATCTQEADMGRVRLTSPDSSGAISALYNGQPLGSFRRMRSEGELRVTMNNDATWLVVEEGVNADSYPTVRVFRIAPGRLVESQDAVAIREKLYSTATPGPPELVFLGFDSGGAPLVNAGGETYKLQR